MAHAPLICLCVCKSTRGEWHKEGSSKSLMYFAHAAYPPQYLRKGQNGLSMPSHWEEPLAALSWFVIMWRIAEREQLKCQPVALNPSCPNYGLQAYFHPFNCTVVSFIIRD